MPYAPAPRLRLRAGEGLDHPHRVACPPEVLGMAGADYGGEGHGQGKPDAKRHPHD